MCLSIIKYKGCNLYNKLMEVKVVKNSKSVKVFLFICNDEFVFGDVIDYVCLLFFNYMVGCKECVFMIGYVYMYLYV